MTSQIDNLVAEADAAAQQLAPAQPATALAPTSQQTTAMAAPSLDSFIDSGGMSVDGYIRMKADGFKIGDDMQGLVDDPIVVEIDMSEVTPIYSFRSEVGGNTKFIKSYNGSTTPDGASFQAACAAAERQPGAKTSGVYQTVELPFTLLEALDDPKKGSSVSFPAGFRVGYTPSVTGFKPFQAFCKQLRSVNPDLLRQTLKVRLVHKKRVNSAKNEWGVFEFELAE